MDISACFKIGYILKPHGLKGEVTIALDPEFPSGGEEVKSVFLDKNKRLVPFFIETISIRGNKAFVKFEDVDSAEAANAISKTAIFLPKTARPKSGRGEFYDDEIIGFDVQDIEYGDLGKIIEITMAGPNKLLAINYNGKEVLIPVNSPFITSINKSKKKVSVSLPEGFLDI